MQAAHPENLRARIRAVFELEPRAVAIQSSAGQWRWEDLARAADAVERALQQAGISAQMPVGWVAHNRAAAVAAFASLIMNGRMVVPLRPRQTSATLPRELTEQRLIAVVADDEDWNVEGTLAAAAAAGTFGIAVTDSAALEVSVVPQLSHAGPGRHRPAMPGYVLERLTSGTTGAPKRIPVLEAVLIPSLRSGEQSGGAAQSAELRLKSSPSILLKPFSHAGGLFGLLLALYQARPMVLMERFSPEEWALAMHRYQPKSASLVPAMIQMILQARIKPDLLRSLKAIRSGTAPLDPQVQAQFEAQYGIPILIDYGAAEFIGGVAGWSLADYRIFSGTKRGSVGRARSDVLLKVTPTDSEVELPPGHSGVLHIKCDRFGPDWHRTNDLACVDEDGFLFLHGRADDAINRGGFKILPEEVAVVLRRYPGVRDAAVIGKPDARLGQVPIAAIEMLPGVSPPAPELLETFAREHLTAYMIPKEFHFVAALPRTASMKVSRPELKVMLGVHAGDVTAAAAPV
jgi:acyl-CoA synthetase (AMP-forming)/AMP-acid ligase II